MGTPANASGEARAFAPPETPPGALGAANAGGFGRRKTPIPATTDGAAPASVANDSVAAAAGVTTGATTAPTTGAGEAPASADSGSAAHPFFSDRATRAPEETRPVHEGPLSVTDERADDLIAWLSSELRVERQVDRYSVLCALGALAGYAAQQAIRETMIKSGRLTLDQAFVVIETRSGEWFFFGDLLNAVLGAQEGSAAGSRNSSQYTIWKIIADAGHQAGAINLPDITDIVKHCAATVGTVEFGLPRLPDVHMPAVLPREAVNRFWQPTLRRLSGTGPMSWPLHLAMAAHKLIIETKDAIRPDIAVRIVMEAAVPMSKVDPVTVPKE